VSRLRAIKPENKKKLYKLFGVLSGRATYYAESDPIELQSRD